MKVLPTSYCHPDSDVAFGETLFPTLPERLSSRVEYKNRERSCSLDQLSPHERRKYAKSNLTVCY